MNRRQRVLAVDDRPENLLALARSLTDLDIEILKVESGAEALAATLEGDFSLALLDVQMPDMDGYELAELLRGDPKTRNLPIIFLTAFSGQDEHISRGYALGAVDYLVKPYQPAILRSKVGILLELDTLRRDLQAQRDHLDVLVAERTSELERVNQRLTRSNAELARFAHAASHDLKEPLRMMSLYTQRLAQRFTGTLDEQADRDMAYVVEGAQRMDGLLDGLLEIASIGSEMHPLRSVNCNELVAETLRSLDDAMVACNAVAEVGELPTVTANSALLAKVFHNLLDNALKFRGDAPPRIEISAKPTEGAWEITIADNGIGIDPAYHERIFLMFQRLHPRNSYSGSGTGLALAKKIVEQHGGTIHVDSIAGAGARFIFRVPNTQRP